MSVALVSDSIDDVPASEPRPPIDLRRRRDAVLQVSRLAAELIWRDGLGAVRGEDIAAAAGISMRTLWRYFRAKQTCAEPVLAALAAPFVELLRDWPRDVAFEDYAMEGASAGPVRFTSDQIHGMRMVSLGRTEPALRSAWLSVCDDGERQLIPIIAERLALPDSDVLVAEMAAGICGANRALNDHIAYRFVDHGVIPRALDVRRALIRAVLDFSGGRLGSVSPSPQRRARQQARTTGRPS